MRPLFTKNYIWYKINKIRVKKLRLEEVWEKFFLAQVCGNLYKASYLW